MKNFRHFIKAQGGIYNWTQPEFGAKTGINATTVNRIECGIQKFSKKTKIQLL